MDGDVRDATSGRLPIGSQLFNKVDGSPVLLEKKVLLTGEYVIDASSGFDQQSGSPAVFITYWMVKALGSSVRLQEKELVDQWRLFLLNKEKEKIRRSY